MAEPKPQAWGLRLQNRRVLGCVEPDGTFRLRWKRPGNVAEGEERFHYTDVRLSRAAAIATCAMLDRMIREGNPRVEDENG